LSFGMGILVGLFGRIFGLEARGEKAPEGPGKKLALQSESLRRLRTQTIKKQGENLSINFSYIQHTRKYRVMAKVSCEGVLFFVRGGDLSFKPRVGPAFSPVLDDKQLHCQS